MEESVKQLISEYAVSFAIIATFTVPLLVELFFTYVWQPATKFLNSVMVFLIAIVVTFAAWPLSVWVGYGFLAEGYQWWGILLWGAGAGAVAQFTWANIDMIHTLIRFLVTLKTSGFSIKRAKLPS